MNFYQHSNASTSMMISLEIKNRESIERRVKVIIENKCGFFQHPKYPNEDFLS